MHSNEYGPTVDELIKELEKQKREIEEELAVLKRARKRLSVKDAPHDARSKNAAKSTGKKTVEDVARQVLAQNTTKHLSVSEIARNAIEMGLWQSNNPVQGMASALKRAEEKQCSWLGIKKGEKRGSTRYYLKKEN